MPELCACGSSAQRKLAQRRAAKPAKGSEGAEGTEVTSPEALESKEHKAATKAGEDAAQARDYPF